MKEIEKKIIEALNDGKIWGKRWLYIAIFLNTKTTESQYYTAISNLVENRVIMETSAGLQKI